MAGTIEPIPHRATSSDALPPGLQLAPMLATAGPLPDDLDDGAWAYEVKWDGVRAMAYAGAGSLRIESRNLLDITPRYPELAGLAHAVPGGVVLDGEVVAFGPDGTPSFGHLQHRMHVTGEAEVHRRMAEIPVLYVVFDVLWHDGRATTSRPFAERRALLESLGIDGGAWRVGSSQVGGGVALSEATKRAGLEGVVAKRRSSPYEAGRRSRSWRKVKNVARQELVIGGWLPGEGSRSGRLGALLLGYHDDSGLRFAGKVGTGFSDATLRDLAARLAPLSRTSSPFAEAVPHRTARFVEPVLVCDVEFTEWTGNATLRHPSYKGLRNDKRAEEVVREPAPG